MDKKTIKIVLLIVLLVVAGYATNRFVVNMWGVDEPTSTTKSLQGTGSTEVVNAPIKDSLVTAYYYDNYAKGVIEYAAVRIFNVNTKECNYIFFPANTLISMSDETFGIIYDASTNVEQEMYLNKIAKCFAQDADRYHFTTLALEDALGIEIDCYEAISSDDAVAVINLLDPVSFDVPKNMKFKNDSSDIVRLKKGAQKLEGNQVKGMITQAELYDSELERLQCMQDYIKEYLTDVVAISDRTELGKYYEQYYSLVKSNTNFNEMRNYFDFYFQMKASNIVMTTAQGKVKRGAYLLDYDKLRATAEKFMLGGEGSSAENVADSEKSDKQEEDASKADKTEEVTEEETTKEEVTEEETNEEQVTEEETTEEDSEAEATTEETSGKSKKKASKKEDASEDDETDESEKKSVVSSKECKIEIYNSTKINGLAAKWKSYLAGEGYQISATETEKRYSLKDPVIYVSEEGMGEDLLEYFPNAKIEVATLTNAEIRIVLGTNCKEVGK